MDCICLKKRRNRKDRGSKKPSGEQNSAFQVEDEDILENNAVLQEMEQTAARQDRGVDPVTAADAADADTKSGTSLPDDNPVKNFECVEVKLQSKDTVGPGFSVTGTMTEGIIISSLHDKGPARESGKIANGDKILSVTIGFDNMAYEDALTILSYAAPYPMTLKLSRGPELPTNHSTSPTAELNHLNSKVVYHPVYRSQSLGGGSHHSKKIRKMPSRPGTSLSQIDYAMMQEHGNEGSQESLIEGTLVKDKFGNTLNLINTSDSALHRHISDSDISKAESREDSTTNLTADSSADETDFNQAEIHQQLVSSSEGFPVVAEVIINEPPTQLKLSALSCSKPNSPTNLPNQIPPEKPKRAHHLASQSSSESLASVGSRSSVVAKEEEIIPIKSPKEVLKLPDWIEEQIDSTAKPQRVEADELSNVFPGGISVEESVEICDDTDDSPVDEGMIEPLSKSVPLPSVSSNDWLVNDSEPSGYSSVMDSKPLSLIMNENRIQVEVKSPSVNETETNQNGNVDSPHENEVDMRQYNTDNDADTAVNIAKPTTLTVDRIKIKDGDELTVETLSASTAVVPEQADVPEQASPNDSGIHSDKAPSERDIEDSNPPTDEPISSDSSSPQLLSLRHKDSSTSDDLMTAVLSLATVRRAEDEKTTNSEEKEPMTPQTPTSELSTPLSTPSSLPVSKFPPPRPDVNIPKATSRSQLEAARTRFFAELMQSSDLFKDTPDQPLTLSSESLTNSERSNSAPREDPFKKYTSAKTSLRSNNNNSIPSFDLEGSGQTTPNNHGLGSQTLLAHSTPDISESSA